MEILAQKKRGLIPLYLFAAILSTVMLTAMYLTTKVPTTLPIIVIGGAIIDVMCIVMCVWIIRTPDQITYENGQVYFGNGYVAPAENITNVEYRQAHSRGWHYRWGKLTIYVDGREFVYRYIADVEAAHNRIINLMLNAKKSKQI